MKRISPQTKFTIIRLAVCLILFWPISCIAQTDCAETVAEVTSIIKTVLEKEQQAHYRNIDTTKGPSATLTFEIHFVYYKWGKMGKMRIKKLECENCKKNEKEDIPKRLIEALSEINGLQPCSQNLLFKQPVKYLLY